MFTSRIGNLGSKAILQWSCHCFNEYVWLSESIKVMFDSKERK